MKRIILSLVFAILAYAGFASDFQYDRMELERERNARENGVISKQTQELYDILRIWRTYPRVREAIRRKLIDEDSYWGWKLEMVRNGEADLDEVYSALERYLAQ